MPLNASDLFESKAGWQSNFLLQKWRSLKRLLHAPPVSPHHFDAEWYLSAYPDVVLAGQNPWTHFRRHGAREGRLPALIPAVWCERDLRLGLIENGPELLQAMAQNSKTANGVYASIACARLEARQGNWRAAHDWLAGLDPRSDIIGLQGRLDTALLAVHAAIQVGDPVAADRILGAARHAFGKHNDITIAQANLVAAQQGLNDKWVRILSGILRRANLSGIDLTPGTEPAFDRLQGAGDRLRPLRQGPLVSVIVPARNAAGTIATALDSLTGQSWKQLEILVVDNGSRDDTARIVLDRASVDSRIRLIDGSAQPGAYPARNIGMQEARGDFLTVLDADDWCHPERIACQLQSLQGDSTAMACLTDWVRATPDVHFVFWWGESTYIHPDISSLMIRKSVLDRLGFWDRVKGGADTEYLERIQAVCGPGSVLRCKPGVPMSLGRIHSGSLTQATETNIESLFSGPRRTYLRQARHWHRGDLSAVLPLPPKPQSRPFPAPASLALAPPDPDPKMAPGLEQAGIYDDDWYMRSYPDLRDKDIDGLTHYLSQGASEGRDPGPDFSTSGYALAHGVALKEAAHHYLSTGKAKGLDPVPFWAGDLPAPAQGSHVLVFGHRAGAHLFGAERCLLTTLDRAAEAGLTPSVVLPHLMNASYLMELRKRSARVHVVPFSWRFGKVPCDPRTLDRLVRLIRESEAREVHQNTCVLNAPLHAARIAGVPTVLHLHELPASDLRLCADLGQSPDELRHELLREAERFVVPSRQTGEWLNAHADKTIVMPNRVDPNLFKLPFTPGRPPRVAMIGSLTRQKGLKDVLTVAQLVMRMGLLADFRLIGPHSPDLDQLGALPANMRHMGYAQSPPEALEQADIVLSLSHVAETFGMSVLEALAAGRPVVCYDRGHPPDLLGGPDASGQRPGGHVVPVDQPSAVAEVLRVWLSKPATLQAASDRARKHAQNRQVTEPSGLFLPRSI